mgnify:CR=1 FL=1
MTSNISKITKGNFHEYISSIDLCIKSLNSIFFILQSFQSIRKDPHIAAIQLLKTQLEGATRSIEIQKCFLTSGLKKSCDQSLKKQSSCNAKFRNCKVIVVVIPKNENVL